MELKSQVGICRCFLHTRVGGPDNDPKSRPLTPNNLMIWGVPKSVIRNQPTLASLRQVFGFALLI